MSKKSNVAFWLFTASIGFIIGAIVFTSIVSRVRSQSASADVRARAGSVASLKFIGVVASLDPATGFIIVDNLKFADNPDLDFGSWTVSPPPGFNLASLVPGKKVNLTVEAKTFIVSSHSLVATNIK